MIKERRQHAVESRQGKSKGFLSTEKGFSLVELLISMLIFVFVIAASSQMLTALLTQFKQQSKIAETSTEGIIGLEILRQDLEHVGYGLPWVIPAGVTYNEAPTPGSTVCGTANPSAYNDSTANPPRAVLSGNNNCTNGSDYLVLKATNILADDASSKWTYLRAGNIVKAWDLAAERLQTSDRVIVLSLAATRTLVADAAGTGFTTRYNAATTPDSLVDAAFAPADNIVTRAVYGVTSAETPVTTPLRMPFNRADFYISTADVPQRCAVGTGVFSKNVVNHAAGTFAGGNLPLLDCVADMQVVYRRDTNDDGTIDNTTNDIGLLTAQQIREQVKEVRVYILAHEGQRDPNFTFNNVTCGAACITVGEFGLGQNFDFAIRAITNWENYRWKIYTIVTKPNNLR